MTDTVYARGYEAPPVDRGEILRYAGARGDAQEVSVLLEECLAEIRDKLIYRVCYREFSVTETGDTLDLGFMKTDSAALRKNLFGCDRIVLMAATVGLEIDRLIARYAVVSPTKALLLQAIGAERIESLCNRFCLDLKQEKGEQGRTVRPRFSAGYGDLPLEAQRQIFDALDCPRRIGLSLNESLLMSPSKSVTAIIGIANLKT